MNKDKVELIEGVVDNLYGRLRSCDICPRDCQKNRLEGQTGYCGAKKQAVVYSSFLHRGEEPGISAKAGSGTIFFSGCNLKCVYCQNYKFSQSLKGITLNDDQLARIMLDLAQEGADNINLVTPTHFLPQILKGLLIAFKAGLEVPIVYNTSGYEKRPIIAQIKGIVDVYLADLRYIGEMIAHKYSAAPNYPAFALESVKEMYNQQPKAVWNDDGILKQGLVIRHLVLPGYIDDSRKILSWIKKNIPDVLVSIMFQYQPYYKANLYPEIDRRITLEEYQVIKAFTEELGIKGWVQDYTSQEDLAGPYFEPRIDS